MTEGNIFHGGLSWPFAEDDDPLDTPARQWGVATAHERIMLCGSGARRGGAVSGLGGQENAFTSFDYTAYFQRVAREQLKTMMAFEPDRMTGPGRGGAR